MARIKEPHGWGCCFRVSWLGCLFELWECYGYINDAGGEGSMTMVLV